jgi:hypothetical protein
MHAAHSMLTAYQHKLVCSAAGQQAGCHGTAVQCMLYSPDPWHSTCSTCAGAPAAARLTHHTAPCHCTTCSIHLSLLTRIAAHAVHCHRLHHLAPGAGIFVVSHPCPTCLWLCLSHIPSLKKNRQPLDTPALKLPQPCSIWTFAGPSIISCEASALLAQHQLSCCTQMLLLWDLLASMSLKDIVAEHHARATTTQVTPPPPSSSSSSTLTTR